MRREYIVLCSRVRKTDVSGVKLAEAVRQVPVLKRMKCLVPLWDSAAAEAVSHWRLGFEPGSGHVGFVDKVALRQVFSEYFGFHLQFANRSSTFFSVNLYRNTRRYISEDVFFIIL
jgi:hypothetical protein